MKPLPEVALDVGLGAGGVEEGHGVVCRPQQGREQVRDLYESPFSRVQENVIRSIDSSHVSYVVSSTLYLPMC